MNRSRLGKFLVVILGAIGLIYIGGGHAHADSVDVSNQTASVSISSASSSTTSKGNQTTTVDSSHNNDQSGGPTVTTNSNNDNNQASAGPDSTSQNSTTGTTNSTNPTVGSNQSGPTASDPASTTSAVDGAGAATDQSQPSLVQVGDHQYLAVPQHDTLAHTAPITIGDSNYTAPAQSSSPTAPAKPATPIMPQGTTALVSSFSAPAPTMRTGGLGGGPTGLRSLAFTLALILLVLVATTFTSSSYLSSLKAAGFATAPRGATTHLQFAFSMSEFGNGPGPVANSLFRNRQLSSWQTGERF